eukprot:CAMPEP_0196758400 /NCGR_PEP_ID=MMETSP1091-20130531/104168_1 /TAXON_ID=302021 /ORGANISM="Rhodomonas sp., Strain CCMP768" /LENGTH=127 /DNA_ID=CAMNT_0042107219 /DNA_START=1028 /DNA_END=1412 /DNA_ORIENTATION=+
MAAWAALGASARKTRSSSSEADWQALSLTITILLSRVPGDHDAGGGGHHRAQAVTVSVRPGESPQAEQGGVRGVTGDNDGDQGEMGLRTRIGTEGKQVEWAAAQQHDRVAGGRTDDDATVTGVILTA